VLWNHDTVQSGYGLSLLVPDQDSANDIPAAFREPDCGKFHGQLFSTEEPGCRERKRRNAATYTSVCVASKVNG
jgi:hypothetical protein